MNDAMIRRAVATASLLVASAVPVNAPASATAYQTIDGVSPVPLVDQAGLGSREELEAFMDGVMAAQMKAQAAVGGTVVVVKDGEIYLAKGYGHADRDQQIPFDAATTLLRTGSVAKLLTWTALMQLVEQGKVDLDADVNAYISPVQVPDTFPGQPITLRNLFTHSGGLEDGAIGFLILDGPERLLEPVDALQRHQPARVRPPAGGDFSNGDMASYSNWGTELAGLIISNVSGMPFNDYIEQHIFEPLGMRSSSFRQPLPAPLAANVSKGYKKQGGRMQPQPFEYVMVPAAGSLSATATDIARFMLAHAQGGANDNGRVLSESATQRMHTRALSPNPHVNGAALGFYENYVNGRRLLVHAGNTTQFRTEFNLLVDEGVGVFFGINTASTQQFSSRRNLLHAFMDRYYPSDLPSVEPPDDFDQRAADYVGNYRFNRHAYSTVEKAFVMLSNGISVSATNAGTLKVSGVGGPMTTEWVEVAPDTFRRMDDDAMIAFSRDDNGEVAYLLNVGYLPSMQAYKVPTAQSSQLHQLILGAAALWFFFALLGVVRHWRADRSAPALARTARWTAGALGAFGLAFMLLFGLSVVTLTNNPLGPYPPTMRLALWAALFSIPLVVLVVLFTPLAWKQGWWGWFRRLSYTTLAVLSVAFVWSLHTWNLIGFKLP